MASDAREDPAVRVALVATLAIVALALLLAFREGKRRLAAAGVPLIVANLAAMLLAALHFRRGRRGRSGVSLSAVAPTCVGWGVRGA